MPFPRVGERKSLQLLISLGHDIVMILIVGNTWYLLEPQICNSSECFSYFHSFLNFEQFRAKKSLHLFGCKQQMMILRQYNFIVEMAKSLTSTTHSARRPGVPSFLTLIFVPFMLMCLISGQIGSCRMPLYILSV